MLCSNNEELRVIKRVINILLSSIICLSLFGCGGNLKSGDLIIEEGNREINIAIFDVDTLNPIKTKSESVIEAMSLIYEPLFTFDEKLNAIPCLADSITCLPDGKTLKLSLNKDAKWHSGAPFVSEDVIYTVNMIKNKDSSYKHNVEPIMSMEQDTDGGILIALNQPVMNIEGLLSFPVIRNGSYDEIEKMPDGTGAFKTEESNATTLKLVANDDKGKSSIGAVNVSIMRNAASCLNAFEAGELDIITSSVVDLGEKTPAGDIDIHRYTSNRMTFIGFNCTLDKYQTPYLRLAIGGIIDREKIVNNALFGKAVICRLPFNPTSAIYNETDGPEIDVSGAFWKAGYEKRDGKYFSQSGEQAEIDLLVCQESSRKVAVAKLISEQLKSEGVAVTVTELPYDDYVKRINNKNYDAFIGEVTMPDNLCPDFLTAEGNYFGYFDQEMADAVYNMKVSNDESFKDAMLGYERIFTVNPPFVTLYFADDGVVYRKNISGITEPNFYNNLRALQNIYFKAV